MPTAMSRRHLLADAKQPVDSTLYLVLRDDVGISVSNTWDGLGMRGNASAPMTLANVQVRADRALTEPGKGLRDDARRRASASFKSAPPPSHSGSPKRPSR